MSETKIPSVKTVKERREVVQENIARRNALRDEIDNSYRTHDNTAERDGVKKRFLLLGAAVLAAVGIGVVVGANYEKANQYFDNGKGPKTPAELGVTPDQMQDFSEAMQTLEQPTPTEAPPQTAP